MNKVVTINLAGQPYQLEEGGYDALRVYLDGARTRLAGNPDQEEIMNDLESAVAQKCSAFLTEQKQVVSASEVEQIIKEMGPVAAEGEAPEEGKEASSASAKRLYRIREGAMIGGICTGLAAYLNIDVTLIRIVLVILAIFTSGGIIAAYVILMAVIPAADTPAQRAQAYGAAPFTAQQLIDRAQEGYDTFKNSKELREWKRRWRDQKRAWKKQWRYDQQYRDFRSYGTSRSPFLEFMQSVLGFLWLLFFGFCLWWGYHHIAPVHDLLDIISQWLTNLVNRLR
jgi:phage shock protein PspC (stress-responsive transcriptional regulator)